MGMKKIKRFSLSVLILSLIVSSMTLVPNQIRAESVKKSISMYTSVGAEEVYGRFDLWELIPAEYRKKDGVQIHRMNIVGEQKSYGVTGHGGGDSYMCGISSTSYMGYNGKEEFIDYTSTWGSKGDYQSGKAPINANISKEFTNLVLNGNQDWYIYLSGKREGILWDTATTYLRVDVELEFSPPNSPPSIKVNNDGTTKYIGAANTLVISGSATDPDGDTLTVSAAVAGVVKSTTTKGDWSLTWPAAELPEGTFSNITVKADDGRGGEASATYSGPIVIDKTPPSNPTITPSITGWTMQDVSVTVVPGSDSGSGVQKTEYSLSGATSKGWTAFTAPFVVSSEGSTTITARTVDRAGNMGMSTSTVRIDRTAPTTPILEYSSPGGTANGWSNEDYRISLIHGDDSMSGIKHSEISIGGQPWQTYSQPFKVSQEGTTQITARSIDNVGNVGPEASVTVRLDRTAPTISISPMEREWDDQDIEVEIRFSDELSGIDPNSRKYSVTQSPYFSYWKTATSDVQHITISDEGEWYVHARVSDLAGNTTDVQTQKLRLQRQPEVRDTWVDNVTTNSITLAWFLPIEGTPTEGYKYWIKNLTTGKMKMVEYPSDSVEDEGLEPGTYYEYEIWVENNVGRSPSKVIGVYTLPAAPGNLAVYPTERDPSTAKIYFDASQSAEKYHIGVLKYYPREPDVPEPDPEIIFQTTVTKATYHQVNNLQPGSNYTIVVVAENESGIGDRAQVGYLSLPAEPGEFTSVAIKTDEVHLSWSTVTTATYHELERNTKVIYGGTETTYRDRGLRAGTEYDYAVSAKNETGFGARAVLDKVITLPGEVNMIPSNIGMDGVTARWESIRGAASYILDIDGQTMTTVTAATYGTVQEYTFGNLKPGTPYRVGIHAINRSGAGEKSELFVKTLPEQLPQGSIEVVDIGETQATLRWPVASGATKYRVSVGEKSYEISGNELRVTGLQGGLNYTAKIEAGNESGYGPSSDVSFLTLPPQIQGIKGGEHAGELRLTWDPTPSASWYTIERDGELLGRTTANTWIVKGLKAGESYSYTLRAVNETGEGSRTPFFWRALPDELDELEVRVEEVSEHGAVLRWQPAAGADKYRIYEGDELLLEVDGDRAVLEELESARQYTGLKIVPVNTGGEGYGARVPRFETLPASDFTVGVKAGEHELQYTFELSSPHEIIVMMKDGKEVYRGTERSFILSSLPSGAKVRVEVWTENSLGQRSKGQMIEAQTLPDGNSGSGGSGGSWTWTGDGQEKPKPTEPVEVPENPDGSSDVQDGQEGQGGRGGAAYTDIDHLWNKEQVLALHERGIIPSSEDGKFGPEEGVTRAEFMDMIVRTLQLEGKEAPPMLFKDVGQKAWYYRSLRIAHANGIVKGYNLEEFRPDEKISREQAAKMLGNSIGSKEMTELSFRDKDRIAHWAKEEVEALAAKEVIKGYPDGTFRPKKEVNRAEGVAFIFNVLK
ncbi:hypothetical protein J6TS7_38080 [Paenibacillus dendritiformis]|uniref:OmpL47-type beta-barrel domain-containing protein n=1 Tax=Paenibacillus TaxID=44249 RepID=UPI001B00DF6C|nr:S-layer homology domain-containing protein [Paenibacillus dendritiformis]GIO80198.1 hypothetical protein J6TS7_38080 [Paenibacillus dendritiformis]